MGKVGAHDCDLVGATHTRSHQDGEVAAARSHGIDDNDDMSASSASTHPPWRMSLQT